MCIQPSVCLVQVELECAIATKRELEEELHGSCAEVDALKQRVEEYCNELRKLMAKEKRKELVDVCCRKSLLRRSFKQMKEAIEEQKLIDMCEQGATELSKRSSSRKGFQALRLATYRSCQIREADKRHAKACLQGCWRAWYLLTIAQKRCKRALQQREKACLCDAVAKLKKIAEKRKLTQDEEKYLIDKATGHWRQYICRRAWKYWSKWIKLVARPRKLKLQEFGQYLNVLSCRQTMAAWRSRIRLKHVRRLKLEQAKTQQRSRQMRRIFMRWFDFSQDRKHQTMLLANGLQLKKRNKRLQVFRCWMVHVKLKQHTRISKELACRHYFKAMKSQAFSRWRQGVTIRQAEARAAFEVNLALKRAAMVFWREHHVLQAIKKKKEMKATIYLQRRERKVAKALLLCWLEEMTSRRRHDQLSQILACRRERALLIAVLHSWMHATFDNLLAANIKYHCELLDAKAQYDEQKLQSTAIDVENLKLIDQLHTLSSEVALLKTNINEKNSQEEELHRALEDGALIEDSLRGELEQQNKWIKELELKVRDLQTKLESKNAEDTVEDVQHSMQLRSLEKALAELRNQYEHKCMQAQSYEKALKETADKLEGASDESQEKLSSALEIAASLRKVLEDRESHFITLETNCRRKELELEEIQRKLASANTSFCETIELRDARIYELEELLLQKQTEMLEARQQLQDLQLALDAKESRVKKVEYEVKLKLERESNKARSCLNSWISPAEQSCPLPSIQNNVDLAQPKETTSRAHSQAKMTLLEDIDYKKNATGRESNDQRHWEANGRQFLMWCKPKFLREEISSEIIPKFTLDENEKGLRTSSLLNLPNVPACSLGAPTSKIHSTAAVVESSPGLNQESPNLSRQNKSLGKMQDSSFGARDTLQHEIEELQARIMSRLWDSPLTDVLLVDHNT